MVASHSLSSTSKTKATNCAQGLSQSLISQVLELSAGRSSRLSEVPNEQVVPLSGVFPILVTKSPRQ
jgi:hypothetical protein